MSRIAIVIIVVVGEVRDLTGEGGARS